MPGCWRCGEAVPETVLAFEAFLLPRTAAKGGPVLLLRCPSCGQTNVVERSSAGETLLSPPSVRGHCPPDLRGAAAAAARAWEAAHGETRREFLGRRRPEVPPLPLAGGDSAPHPHDASPPSPEGPPSSPEGPRPPPERPPPSPKAPRPPPERPASSPKTPRSSPEAPPPPPGEPPPPASTGEVREILEAYEVLGLPLTASAEEIRRQYRRLARTCHPDRVADLDPEIRALAERKFRRLRSAYERLSNESPGAAR